MKFIILPPAMQGEVDDVRLHVADLLQNGEPLAWDGPLPSALCEPWDGLDLPEAARALWKHLLPDVTRLATLVAWGTYRGEDALLEACLAALRADACRGPFDCCAYDVAVLALRDATARTASHYEAAEDEMAADGLAVLDAGQGREAAQAAIKARAERTLPLPPPQYLRRAWERVLDRHGMKQRARQRDRDMVA